MMKSKMTAGFTLIEVLIASVIFAQVALVGAAALSGVFRVEKQTTILRSRQQPARYVLETVARDIRWAESINAINPIGGNNSISLESDSKKKKYYLNNSKIYYKEDGDDAVLITSDDIVVDDFIITGKPTPAPSNHPIPSSL